MKIINHQNTKTTFPIAIIVSRFNEPVTRKLLEGAQKRCNELGFEEVTVVHVPGAVEIPLVANNLAHSGKYKAVVMLGAVIRGETTHYDYVCEQVSDACRKIMLKSNLPLIFGVLTTENSDQAFDRVGGAHGHKGVDAIDAAVEMVAVMEELNSEALLPNNG